MKASILDLRRRMSEVLKSLERNEPVSILHRGKEKGIIYPTAPKDSPISVEQHPAFGMWKDRNDLQDVDQAVRSLRKGRGHAL
jgi:antitoxin (DNA-binding transcriptional repressor) of toxin-antitoxin stability system